MPLSVNDIVDREDLSCEDLIECVNGSSELDKEVYFLLLEDEELNLDQIAEKVDRERSTAYRSVKRLRENGFLTREKVGQDGGGYMHVYRPVDVDKVADRMVQRLNNWYAEMGGLIHEFREKYSDEK